jgi:hypothetical protein
MSRLTCSLAHCFAFSIALVLVLFLLHRHDDMMNQQQTMRADTEEAQNQVVAENKARAFPPVVAEMSAVDKDAVLAKIAKQTEQLRKRFHQARQNPAPSIEIDPRFQATYLSSASSVHSIRDDVVDAIRKASPNGSFSIGLKLSKSLVSITLCQADPPTSAYWQGVFCRAVREVPGTSPEEKDFDMEFMETDPFDNIVY